MTEVVGIKFRSRGKIYSFDPNGARFQAGQMVIVETAKGLEMGECARENHEVDDERIVPPLRPVVRTATEDDLKVARDNRVREAEATEICRQKIIDHELDMKLVDVECNFEGNKILFFFTSDGRVDFRELVKDLASVFRMRIELRQIGVRDEAKMLGGMGICGRPFCCKQFLDDFQPVSTKMAKTQSMSLNPAKISGSCGRLMCCLRYEQEAYEDLVRRVPKNGTFVETPMGYGNVFQVNLLRQKVKVKIDGDGEQVIKQFDADQVAAVPGGRPKAGEIPPSVLKFREEEAASPEEEAHEEPGRVIAEIGPVSESSAATPPPRKKSPHHRGGRKTSSQPKGDPKPGAPRPKAQKPREEGRPAAEGKAAHESKGAQAPGKRHRRYGKPKPGPGKGESAAPQ